MEEDMIDDSQISTKYFCPACGFEGNDLICPVCNIKMESLEHEVEKVAKIEEKEDILDDVSFEDAYEQENKESEKESKQDEAEDLQ